MEAVRTKELIIISDDAKQHGTVKALLRNFRVTEKEMAIKENQNDTNKCVYSVPITPAIQTARTKSISEAKKAFLNATVSPNAPPTKPDKRIEPTVHYAQLDIITKSEDTRSTGGGHDLKTSSDVKSKETPNEATHAGSHVKRKIDPNQRKVSFKIKTAGTFHRRPPIAAKTVTVATSNVSELTHKFNLLNQPHSSPKHSKLAKTIEGLQTARRSLSNSSTPSSTLSSSPNIKIVVRQKRGSKKRNHRKRCSSMDSIDKLIITDKESTKIQVIRSKSDGIKAPKYQSSKKKLKYYDSNEHQNGSDSVDGLAAKSVINEPEKDIKATGNNVKSVIKKFECEINAQTINTNTIKKQPDPTKSIVPLKEKPKVPEKKSSIVLTKNIVVKDGIPKIKTIRPISNSNETPRKTQAANPDSTLVPKKKELIYDRKKYKTNYIHTEKLPLKLVEIIPEDIENTSSLVKDQIITNISNETSINITRVSVTTDSKAQDVEPPIIPNESFLWRRKSSTQIYAESDLSSSADISSCSLITITTNDNSISCDEAAEEQSQTIEVKESQMNVNACEKNMDFESDLVEAYNKEILVGYTPKPQKEPVIEDDYEVLEPRESENIVVIPVKQVDMTSKMNCPLPEIPKQTSTESSESDDKENIYQCLLEMRSHPEGDESSLHNYELCENELEERTRGDGDSDDGYEYCKSPIKPYCLTSSSGIQIAEDYKPYNKDNNKNYAISKSVSGTSTVSYEKIGCDRIYEKIPPRPPKSKDSSPTYSDRHSFISDYIESENIYDTIKHGDGSLSHCYESIPNSPSMVKLRNNLKKQLASAVQKRLSFDTVSNISQSTLSSEQKTNSIYGQRSVISFNGQEVAFQVPCSETSVSDRSDRSDDWVDVSDEEKNEQKIVIVRERSRGRKSPISWSQKVRHQWLNSPKKSDSKECDSSDSSGHLYESLEPAPSQPPRAPVVPIEEDFDSFDSDSDPDDNDKTLTYAQAPPLPASKLPTPPSGGQYTLTKIASAAQRTMKSIKRNLTKRYSVAMDGKSFTKSSQNGTYEAPTKTKKTPIYANYEKPEIQNVYSNISFNDTKPVLNKAENPVKAEFQEELKYAVSEKRPNISDVPPPLPEKPPPERPMASACDMKKDSGTLSRKAYFSFKSRFRRATSLAVDINDVPSALKITNSTFYLTDSMDGDSGFSNCDGGQASSSETPPSRRGEGTLRYESTPCLALERPSVPPPPPPTDISAVNEELKRLLPTLARKDKSPRARTSWYAECGADATSNTASTSWYAEAGLYQAGNLSTSSGASSGSHPASPLPRSLFTHEPLYQFYNAAKVESIYRETGDSDSDGYEAGVPGAQAPPPEPARPSAMALVSPRGPARTLWCEVPEVLNSAVLSSLAPAQKRLQEAKFELLTSEASYLNSLNVLESQFVAHPAFRDPHILPRDDWETLFSTILPVRKCSQLLMNELEKCWQENILLQGICDIVRHHAEEHFQVYVKYCENQALMVKALQRLRERPAFATALKRLESHPACQSLSLHSFLMLPMQRVTRLPLLMDAVLKNLSSEDEEYEACMHALATLNNYVQQCNEGARNTERVEEMYRLARVIEFPAGVRHPPDLGPALARRDRRPVRWLVRSGEMTQLVWKNDELKLTFGKKFHKVPLHVFLFNDLLVVTKKKGEESYVAVDHCPRSLLEVCSAEGVAATKHALLLTLLDNHEGRTVEMLMSCGSETEVSRWREALWLPAAAPGEAVYAGWDCPQVCALYAYGAAQPDELSLAEGDVVNVTRKTAEGWYYGERTRDGEAGWFPGAYSAEIASPHVRARNLRQRYRLLALSGTYLGNKRKLL
ncbi:uncharacterized protein LOC114246952 isoform X2 [Bombyx mandarina]|uniref:Uncharacterized protein LOC114246952 isoform X2 n=1 Tax=Bombyx mandarina TaxID=7092 RepID=A0A6J2JZX7_BOMMA|nr:uncharacterized protein LOC114246952 isoform X2 [Bombyx mandarina]